MLFGGRRRSSLGFPQGLRLTPTHVASGDVGRQIGVYSAKISLQLENSLTPLGKGLNGARITGSLAHQFGHRHTLAERAKPTQKERSTRSDIRAEGWRCARGQRGEAPQRKIHPNVIPWLQGRLVATARNVGVGGLAKLTDVGLLGRQGDGEGRSGRRIFGRVPVEKNFLLVRRLLLLVLETLTLRRAGERRRKSLVNRRGLQPSVLMTYSRLERERKGRGGSTWKVIARPGGRRERSLPVRGKAV